MTISGLRRREFLKCAGACATAMFLGGGASSGATRPNVVVILSDDQGWGDLSLNGNSNLRTPNIDSLARDGARIDRFSSVPSVRRRGRSSSPDAITPAVALPA